MSSRARPRPCRRLALVATVIIPLSFYGVLPALAETTSQTPWHLAASLGLFTAPSRADVSTIGVPAAIVGSYHLSNGWYFKADWGLTWARVKSASIGELQSVAPSNLLLGAGYAILRDDFVLAVGARISAPLAIFWIGTIPNNRAAEFSYTGAASARGWRDPYLWQINVAPIIADAMVGVTPLDWLRVNIVVSPAVLVPVNSRPLRVALHASAEAEATRDRLVVRAGWSYFLSTLALENNDLDQHSVGVGLGLALAKEQRLRLDLNLNLDAPYGVASGAAKTTWGLVFASEHRF